MPTVEQNLQTVELDLRVDAAGAKSGPQRGAALKHSGLGRSSLVSVLLSRLILF